jgi:hypothetical protein
LVKECRMSVFRSVSAKIYKFSREKYAETQSFPPVH